MTVYKTALRQVLKPVMRSRLPGRYFLMEMLRPLLVQDARVITKTHDDIYFDIDLRDTIQRQIFFDLYDSEVVHFLSQFVAEGDVVFDIGGNVGFYAMHFAHHAGPSGKVHVFEPIPKNVEAIHRNVRLNNLEHMVAVAPVAVSEQPTELNLYVSDKIDNTGWASIVSSASRTQVVKVQAISIDQYVREHNIKRVSLIKMDIEGAELYALKGMRNLLSQQDAPMIYFEINPHLLKSLNVDPIEIKLYLHDLGYSLQTRKNHSMVMVSPDAPEEYLCDILATKLSTSKPYKHFEDTLR